MGVEPDTTMRDRREAKTNPNTDKRLQAPGAPAPSAVPFERIFQPDSLDLYDLAEAIRLLLGRSLGPQIASASRPDAHLLSVRHRVTHVVEATGTH